MNHYRICKYPASCLRNGSYFTDEWTSFSDIGKVCGGTVLTMDEYLRVETNYLTFLMQVCGRCGAESFEIKGLETYEENLPQKNGMMLEGKDIEAVCRDILREKYWCRLEADQMQIHFGYDFYMHIGCELSEREIKDIAAAYGLSVDMRHEEFFEEEE